MFKFLTALVFFASFSVLSAEPLCAEVDNNSHLVKNVIVAQLAWCQKNLANPATSWVQVSDAQKNRPGKGYTYDAAKNVFTSPQPFPSWTLDTNSKWQPPIPMPTDGKMYSWDEGTKAWIVRVMPTPKNLKK